jgi:hypothetical protein
MKELIPPIARQKLREELTPDTFVRKTNNGSNEIHILDHYSAPTVLQEIGRLRELSFRLAGGGTGKEVDLDKFDLMEKPFRQLIVWSPREQEIIGGYRFILCSELENQDGEIQSPTGRLFRISPEFVRDIMPLTIELGRSFVQPAYQPQQNLRGGMYSLDNLWDGLGSLVVDFPHIQYFFGKITMYPHFNTRARDLILHFLSKHFPSPEGWVVPYDPLSPGIPENELNALLPFVDYEQDYKHLIKSVRALGESIPPLVNAYMNLSASMRVFGTSINTHFGDVEETGILLTIPDIYPQKIERHISTYHPKVQG